MKPEFESLEILPDAEWKVIAPGRVNLLGEHVDYNDGMVLPMAINSYVKLAAKKREDARMIIHAATLNEAVEFSLEDLNSILETDGSSLPRWALYPVAVAWAFQQQGYHPEGLEAVITSDIPIGAGLSSSAAVELAFAEYWRVTNNWQLNRMRLAQICQLAEKDFVGVNCGLMDQFACAHGIARHVLFFDIRTLAWQPIPLPLNVSVVIADSRIQRNLSASEYNQRRIECETALEFIQGKYSGMQALRDVLVKNLNEIEKFLPYELFQRVRHVVEEIERVKKGCFCLMENDAIGFGKLMAAGHDSLRDFFKVSTPELDGLVEIANTIESCYGVRLTGAGFGGCTVNLVKNADVEEFSDQLTAAYKDQFGLHADVYVCKPARGMYSMQL